MSVITQNFDTPDLVQLLLFVDERVRGTLQYQEIISYLHQEWPQSISLQIIDVVEQPSLAEYFKLVATPTLVKVYPDPRQTFAGSNLLTELKKWLPNWMDSIAPSKSQSLTTEKTNSHTDVNQIGELIRLADEVFQLRQQHTELEEQLRFKEQATRNIAHDLRNPLTAAMLALDTLSISKNSEDVRAAHLQTAMVQKLLQRAREQLQVADRMVTDILQLSQVAAAEITINPHPCELQELVQSAFRQVEDVVQKKHQCVTFDLPQDLPLVYVDSKRVQQVIVNLLENASKYTPVESKIQVTALHRTTQKVQVSIIDDGDGIPEQDFKLVFQKNYRLQRDAQSDGYGLGLALCKKIILAHYGQIWVDSAGQGATFHFTLPVYA